MNVRHTIKKNMIKKPIGTTIPRIRPSPKIAIMVIAMKKMKKMRGKLIVRGATLGYKRTHFGADTTVFTCE